MTARHMDSLIRLAEANARIELRHHVPTAEGKGGQKRTLGAGPRGVALLAGVVGEGCW